MNTPPGNLRPTNFARDTKQMAELIELCFKDSMSGEDLAAIREMRAMGAFSPLMWLVSALDPVTMGLGFVWEVEGRIVGNVSTYRMGRSLTGEGAGWIVANVAVHPDFRLRGIARQLMEAALELIRRERGQRVILQLDDTNQAAHLLYKTLGFEGLGLHTQWTYKGGAPGATRPDPTTLRPRSRRGGNWQPEVQLATQDRLSGLVWGRPLTRHDFKTGLLSDVANVMNGKRRHRWTVGPASQPQGSLWADVTALGSPRLTLFLHPESDQHAVGLALVSHALHKLGSKRSLSLEVSEREGALPAALGKLGFNKRRSLYQMRLVL